MRALKFLLWSMVGLLGLVLAIGLAWMLANWHDAPEQPRPAALALPKPQLPEEVNRFHALAAVHQGLPEIPVKKPLSCQARAEDCFALWTRDLQALAQARQAWTAHGQRCDALAGESFDYEEKLPARLAADSALPPFQNHARCNQWWLSGAVLAWAGGDRVSALTQFGQADRFVRALLAGSHSLIGVMVSESAARLASQITTGVALKDAEMARALLPLLAPLPDAAACARRWIVVESAFLRNTLDDMARGRGWPEPDAESGRVGEWSSKLLRTGIGFHPQRTLQQADARWLRWLAHTDGGIVVALRAVRQEQVEADSQGLWRMLTWRNTIGTTIMAVAEPAFTSYFARQADLELQRELAYLAVSAQAEGIAPAQRTAWSQTQTVSATTRERMAWSSDGKALSAPTWETEVQGAGAHNGISSVLRVVWPDAQPITH
jgi:hypothetical protein